MVLPIPDQVVTPTAVSSRLFSKGWWRKILHRNSVDHTRVVNSIPNSMSDQLRSKSKKPGRISRVSLFPIHFMKVTDKGDSNLENLPNTPTQDTVRFSRAKKEIKCSDCGRKFNSDLVIYQHCRIEHADTFVITRCCNSQFYTFHAIASHSIYGHHGQYVCIRCHEYFEPNLFADHLAKHGVNGVSRWIFCNECGQCFTSNSDAVGHLKEEQHTHRYPCTSKSSLVPLPLVYECRKDGIKSGLSSGRVPSVVPCFPVSASTKCLFATLWNL
ncbi:gastrula zinc finger protein XlCGF8.2DB-like [Varroa destructor]|uniref:C2H2-type domain-containing protein n=1 Tax=Varroa destructor TaxID=109461 RepID=A0A7M7KQA9_VARDE|nr:gastrula zinc finger protein XlCGF8.2DB-like [Varroa destructor]